MINLTFKRDELLKALDFCNSSIEKKHPNIILTNILFSFKDSECTLSATNLETTVVAKTHLAEPASSEGKIAVSALYIFNICKLAIGENVVFVYDDANNVLNVRSGKSEYNVPCPDASDFPAIPQTEKEFKKIQINRLVSAFKKVQFSIAEPNTTPAYSGVLVIKNKEDEGMGEHIEFVTTDIHRLSVLSLKNFDMDFEEIDKGIVIPEKSYTEMNKIFADSEEAEMTIDDEKIFVKNENVLFISRLLKNEFPNHRPIIGTYESINAKEFAVVNRSELIEAIKRTVVLSSDEKIWTSIYNFKGSLLSMSANTKTGGSSNDEIVMEQGFSTEKNIAVNARYFLDVVGVVDGANVNIILDDPTERRKMPPMVIKEESDDLFYVHMVMPLRI